MRRDRGILDGEKGGGREGGREREWQGRSACPNFLFIRTTSMRHLNRLYRGSHYEYENKN